MTRSLFAALLFAGASTLNAQTYYYIDAIVVDPQPATTQDVVSIDLIGNLSSSGAYVASASAQITGTIVTISIVAADPGGLAVLVPHTETIVLGQLPAGTYTILFNAVNVADFAPSPQHQFVVVGAGSPCDSLVIDVRWHAFSDTAIVVHVLNNSSQLFDYPNFVLFDEDGDTLAVETVNFFGIATESWHLLRIHPDGTLPTLPYYGALHLWSGFTTVLECEWLVFIDLCPPEPCADMLVTIGNMGGALAIGTYGWTLYDDALQVAATGELEMIDTVQYDSDPVCLPPGNYALEVSPNAPPTGGQPVFGVSTAGWISGPWQPVVWSLPVQMPFPFYLPCVDGTNDVAEPGDAAGLVISQGTEGITLRTSDGSALGEVRLLDLQGRAVRTYSTIEIERTFGHDVADGVYLLASRFGVIKAILGR